MWIFLFLQNYMFLRTVSARALFNIIDKVVVTSKILNLRELKSITIQSWIMDYPTAG